MGVIYKLLPEVNSYIIEQKQEDPKATCKNLAGRVFLKFGQQVSKSSVHELLKRSGVIKTRIRKTKDKFQIPLEKKAQIFKALEPFVKIEASQRPIETTKVKQDKELRVLKKTDVYKGAGEIFLKAALWDLSFKPILGITDLADLSLVESSNLKLEWEYLTQLAYVIKFETKNGKSFYLDCRLQGIYAQNPKNEQGTTSIERAAAEVADYILNNIQPVVIREIDPNVDPEVLNYFIAAFENSFIEKVFLLGERDQVFAEFSWPEGQKRQFIVKIPHKHQLFQWVMEDQRLEIPWQMSLKGTKTESQLKIVKSSTDIFLTNLISMTCEEIIAKYQEVFPGEHRLTRVSYNLKEPIIDSAQWIRARLKERALMFFPSDFALNGLEQILNLDGFEESDEQSLKIHLQVPAAFEHAQNLRVAAESINNLSINDFTARKLKIIIEQ